MAKGGHITATAAKAVSKSHSVSRGPSVPKGQPVRVGSGASVISQVKAHTTKTHKGPMGR
jgi:hypothetical protein